MKPASRHPLTPDESDAIVCLGQVRYPVASWDKRFAHDLIDNGPRLGITDNQAPQLWRLLMRYRRQWRHANREKLLALAAALSAPDLRKVAAAERERAEIERMKSKYQEAMDAGGKPAQP